jgi:hypothetical protein
LKQLKELSVGHVKMLHLQAVSNSTQLQSLAVKLDGCPGRDCFGLLSGLTGLQSLSLEYTESREPTGLGLLRPVLTRPTALEIIEKADGSAAGQFADYFWSGMQGGVWPAIKLQKLRLRSQRCQEIISGMFLPGSMFLPAEPARLRVLDVSGSRALFPDFHSHLSKLTALEELYLGGCEDLILQQLEAALPELSRLTKLDLSAANLHPHSGSSNCAEGLSGVRRLTLQLQLRKRPQLSSLQHLPLLRCLHITAESIATGAAAGAAARIEAANFAHSSEEWAFVHLLQSVNADAADDAGFQHQRSTRKASFS